jgi:predicted N-acetyltransferase YhbS
MEIRYLSNDAEELKQVASWIYSEWGILRPDNSVEKIQEHLSKRHNSALVPLTLVAVDAAILGTASLVENEYKPWPELTPFLSSLYVPPEYRKRGVGEALCRQVLGEAKRLGYGKCYLVTDKYKNFYEKRGWKTILEYVYRDAPAFLMEIVLL